MIRTQYTRDAVFNPDVHISYSEAAKMVGFAPKYFTSKVSPAYKLIKYTDGHHIYYLKDDITKLQDRIKRNMNKDSKRHKRGTITKNIRRARKTRMVRTAPKEPQNGHTNEMSLTVNAATIQSLLKQGIKIKLVMN